MTLLHELRNYEEVRTSRIFTRQGDEDRAMVSLVALNYSLGQSNSKVKKILDRKIAKYEFNIHSSRNHGEEKQ